MKCYLSSQYGRKFEMAAHAVVLENNGHQVISRWISENLAHKAEDDAKASLFQQEQRATRRLEDLGTAQVFFAFTESETNHGTSRGGRHVELGVALAGNKVIVVVGPREHIFHTLADLWYPTFEEFLTDPVAMDLINLLIEQRSSDYVD